MFSTTLALVTLAAAAPSQLTVERIFSAPYLAGVPPQNAHWSPDGSRIAFIWEEGGKEIRNLWVVGSDGSGLKRLTDWEADYRAEIESEKAKRTETKRGEEPVFIPFQSLGVSDLEWSPDGKRILYSLKGDLYLVDATSGDKKRLTRTDAREPQGRFSPDGKRLAFVRDRDLYTLDLDDGALVQLTQSKSEDVSHLDPQWSPDGARVAFTYRDQKEVKTLNVPTYFDEFVAPGPMKYARVGADIADYALGIVASEGGPVKLIDVEGGRRFYGPGGGDSWFGWSPDGKNLYFNHRTPDAKTRTIYVVDPAEGRAVAVEREREEKWIAGLSRFIEWSPDGKSVLFTSERDGWNHIYITPTTGDTATQLTRGRFEVSSPKWSKDGKTIFFTSSAESPYERHFYRVAVSGGAAQKLTARAGVHQAELSPREDRFFAIWSDANEPPELFVSALDSAPVQVTRSPRPDFKNYVWIEPQIVTFKSRADGESVSANLYVPAGLDKSRRHPAVVFVHGAGYMQNVHRGWKSYWRENLFHHLLMERGFVVLDVDYRGSAGYGQKWRTDVYLHLGGLDLEDELSGVDYLKSLGFVDGRRIGIYGGSYGGFMTLMALFKSPGTYAAGAALRPVTDWENYNASYTVERLTTPKENPEAYERSSPIHFADGLSDRLLILHGLVDSNVHAQDSIQLIDHLVRRGKRFDVMLYPRENHGFVYPESWIDEYRRIEEFFMTQLQRNGKRTSSP